MKTNENTKNNLEKARLMILDYVQYDGPDKDIFLALAGNYIRQAQDPETELIYDRLCVAGDAAERELYLEILMDLLGAKESASN